MFILNFLIGLIEIGIVGIAGMYLYTDWRRGFPMVHGLIQRCMDLTQRVGIGLTEVKRAEMIVNQSKRMLAGARESVAEVQARQEMHAQWATEQQELAAKFRHIGERALRSGDAAHAKTALTVAHLCDQQAETYAQSAQAQHAVLADLQAELGRQELKHATIQVEANVVFVNTAVASAYTHTYQLASSVVSDKGVSMKGSLQQLREGSEFQRRKTGKLLQIAQENEQDGLVQRYIEEPAIEQELEALRQRIALTDGQTSSSNGALVPVVEYQKE